MRRRSARGRRCQADVSALSAARAVSADSLCLLWERVSTPYRWAGEVDSQTAGTDVPGAVDPAADRLQAGGYALLLLADPVSVSILRQLAAGPLENAELLDRVDFVSRSTYFER